MITTDLGNSLVDGGGGVIALYGGPFQSDGASPAVWDHTVLPVTRHRWTRPAATPAR